MSNQKGIINIILLGAIVALLLICAAYLTMHQDIIPPTSYFPPSQGPSPSPTPNPVVCTQEAKLCPDGSYVSRTGPNCEFTQCPVVNPTPTPSPTPTPGEKQVTLHEGDREASLLVQKIYPTYITGLNFREYPVATNQGQPITLHINEIASNGCTITLTLISISNSTATFTEKTDTSKPCPL